MFMPAYCGARLEIVNRLPAKSYCAERELAVAQRSGLARRLGETLATRNAGGGRSCSDTVRERRELGLCKLLDALGRASIAAHELRAKFREPHAAAAGAAGARRRDGLAERSIEAVDEQPGTPVTHVHLARRAPDGPGLRDGLEQLDFSRSDRAMRREVDAEADGRHGGQASCDPTSAATLPALYIRVAAGRWSEEAGLAGHLSGIKDLKQGGGPLRLRVSLNFPSFRHPGPRTVVDYR